MATSKLIDQYLIFLEPPININNYEMNFTKIKGDVVMMTTYTSLRSLEYKKSNPKPVFSLEFYH